MINGLLAIAEKQCHGRGPSYPKFSPVKYRIKGVVIYFAYKFYIHPQKLTWPLKNDSWKTTFLLWNGPFFLTTCQVVATRFAECTDRAPNPMRNRFLVTIWRVPHDAKKKQARNHENRNISWKQHDLFWTYPPLPVAVPTRSCIFSKECLETLACNWYWGGTSKSFAYFKL